MYTRVIMYTRVCTYVHTPSMQACVYAVGSTYSSWLTSCDLVKERVPVEGLVSSLHAREVGQGWLILTAYIRTYVRTYTHTTPKSTQHNNSTNSQWTQKTQKHTSIRTAHHTPTCRYVHTYVRTKNTCNKTYSTYVRTYVHTFCQVWQGLVHREGVIVILKGSMPCTNLGLQAYSTGEQTWEHYSHVYVHCHTEFGPP